MKRRNFIHHTIFGGMGLHTLYAAPQVFSQTKPSPALRIGICADLHHDIIPDGPRRLKAFIDEMNSVKPDFIIQMGDFCVPQPTNRQIVDIWNEFKGPKYHVLGNHDTDGGYNHQQVVRFLNAQAPYYSFDSNGFHMIVLNANEEVQSKAYAGAVSVISDQQQEWLENDLSQTDLPVLVFCHQGLDNDAGGGVHQGSLIRALFDRNNAQGGTNKVKMVFSGHHHQDYHNTINGIHYVQINSMSYQWMGEKYAHAHYSAEIEKANPGLKYIAPYEDPIWAILTIYQDGTAEIKGRRTVFMPPAPEKLNRPKYHAGYPDVPYISDRKFQLIK
ncbi:metallophosphoesterase family protein [Sphingobacterium kitahiroshimense]|uniref:Metallophosphoesterase n=1 Tax=Sphingobacterium kitahiroshimense TaxID=470446 RepID=A0ABV0BVU9_9SPHI